MALFETSEDVEREDGQNGAVHCHGDRDLAQIDIIEEHVHVQDGVDRDTSLTHITYHARVVGVVATVCREVECDGQTLLAGGNITLIEGVGLFGCGEARVLAHCPRTESIHGSVWSAKVGLYPGCVVEVLHAFVGVFSVERIDVDLLHGFGDEFVDTFTGFLFDLCGPVLARGVWLGCGVVDICKIRFHYSESCSVFCCLVTC